MQTLPAELMGLIVLFQPLFTKSTWENAQVLLRGALLAHQPRTVTACLRVLGLDYDFSNLYAALNHEFRQTGSSGIRVGAPLWYSPLSVWA